MKNLKFFAAVALVPAALSAGVNIKNGNFYISYTDIKVPGGQHEVKITRTYNSKSTGKGWFGHGWGSRYETRLVPAADGSVVIHENGSGAKTRFTSKGAVDPAAAAERIVAAMRAKGALAEGAARQTLDKLKGDAAMRQAYSVKYGVRATLAPGTVLRSSTRGVQTVTATAAGYERRHHDGKTEVFGKDGRLRSIRHKDGYRVTLSYKKGNGPLASIKDSQGKQLFFSWNSDGTVKELWSSKNEKAAYKYGSKGDLVESKDVSGNVYKHDYDSNHNMTKITYADGTTRQISYDPKTQFATRVTNRSGRTTSYEYGADRRNPDLKYWTKVTRTGLDKKPRTDRYEYEIKVRPDGSKYTHRLATEIAGVKTETVYDERFALPEKITKGKDVTTFDYNDGGLLTKKSSTSGEFVNLSYDGRCNKISKVENKGGWSSFDYNKQCTLAKATNSEGRSVVLVHDAKGRIKTMVSKDKGGQEKSLSFQYNAMGKPFEIAMKNVGKINVAYDNKGGIKKVDSKEGPKMALQVTEAFQSLKDIVKPSGVSLNM